MALAPPRAGRGDYAAVAPRSFALPESRLHSASASVHLEGPEGLMRANVQWLVLLAACAAFVGAASAQTCPAGQAVSEDTRGHCCWPAQAWSSGRSQCVGIPQCAEGFELRGEACVP